MESIAGVLGRGVRLPKKQEIYKGGRRSERRITHTHTSKIKAHRLGIKGMRMNQNAHVSFAAIFLTC